MFRTITKYIIVIGIAVWVVWDLIAWGFLDNATITSVVHEWAIEYPMFNSAVFFVMGHLFWPYCRKKNE